MIKKAFSLAVVGVLAWSTTTANAAEGTTQPKAPPRGEDQPKTKSSRKAKALGAPSGKSGSPIGDLLGKKDKPAASKAAGPVVISKPVWNQTAGFGLPVPPGWSAKVEGTKIILTSPDPEGSETVITLGPEPTDLEASDYLTVLQRELAERKIMSMPQPPQDFLDKTVYIAAYLDTHVQPPGFGAILVMDRPGDQVFVIRVLTRDQDLIKNYTVLGSLAMLRFRGEPLPSPSQVLAMTRKKVRLVPDKITVTAGAITRAEMRMPKILRDMARKLDFKGEVNRYFLAIAAPKPLSSEKAWPVLIVNSPATEENHARYQPLADSLGIVVVAIQPQNEADTWPPEVHARVCFITISKLGRFFQVDRDRVYLMGSGNRSKSMQAVAALLPLARGVICHEGKEDGLGTVLAQSAEAKERLAAVVAHAGSSKLVNAAQAEALAETWKKAGLTAVRVCTGKDDRQAIHEALTWLLERDRAVVEAELPKLMASAEALVKDKPGEAITIYRRVLGSGLKNPQVDQAAKRVKDLLQEYQSVVGIAATQPSDADGARVADHFRTALRYLGTPEGSHLMDLLATSLRAQ